MADPTNKEILNTPNPMPSHPPKTKLIKNIKMLMAEKTIG